MNNLVQEVKKLLDAGNRSEAVRYFYECVDDYDIDVTDFRKVMELFHSYSYGEGRYDALYEDG